MNEDLKRKLQPTFSIRNMLIACFLMALLLAYFRQPLVRWVRNEFNTTLYELVETEKDAQRMLAAQNTFVIINADWSVNSVIARRSVDEFVQDWKWFDKKPEVSFFTIDITKKNQLLELDSLSKWLDSDARLSPFIGGYGDIAWIQKGIVLKTETLDWDTTPEELAVQTKQLFSK